MEEAVRGRMQRGEMRRGRRNGMGRGGREGWREWEGEKGGKGTPALFPLPKTPNLYHPLPPPLYLPPQQ